MTPDQMDIIDDNVHNFKRRKTLCCTGTDGNANMPTMPNNFS